MGSIGHHNPNLKASHASGILTYEAIMITIKDVWMCIYGGWNCLSSCYEQMNTTKCPWKKDMTKS